MLVLYFSQNLVTRLGLNLVELATYLGHVKLLGLAFTASGGGPGMQSGGGEGG
jgi:hypothetical protein